MKNHVVKLCALCMLALLGSLAQAQNSVSGSIQSQQDVIIVLNERFVEGQPNTSITEPRQHRNPDMWNHDVRTLRAIQAIERKHSFVGDKPFSAIGRGFAAKLSARQQRQLLQDPAVASIIPDMRVFKAQQTIPWGIDKVNATKSSTMAGDGSGSVRGANVFVFDSGIASHPDMLITRFVNFTGDKINTDCNGHGTHVAGTVAALDNTGGVVGVAPGVSLYAIKVLGCDGSGLTSSIISAMDWVIRQKMNTPKVVNMSISGPANTYLDNALAKAVNSRVTVVVAAGNEGKNACLVSPARMGSVDGVITVAAVNSTDQEPNFSNYGNCVDVWAPGTDVLSTFVNSGFAYSTGTSMAAPHVAGAAALMAARSPSFTPASLENAMKLNAVKLPNISKDGRYIQRLNLLNY